LMLFDPIEEDSDSAFDNRAATLKLEIEGATNARRRLLQQYGDDDAAALIRQHEQTRDQLRKELAGLELERSQAARRNQVIGEWEQVAKLRVEAKDGAPDERQTARCKLREAVRSVISLLAFYPDGSVAVQTGKASPVYFYRLNGARNGFFRLSLIVPFDSENHSSGSAARLLYDEPEVRIENSHLQPDELTKLNSLTHLCGRLTGSRGQTSNYLAETVTRRSDRIRTLGVRQLEAEMKKVEARLSRAGKSVAGISMVSRRG